LKKITGLLSLLLVTTATKAQQKRMEVPYNLPDSVKVISLIAAVQPPQVPAKKKWFAGISANKVTVALETGRKKSSVYFSFPETGLVVAKGLDVKSSGSGKLIWDFDTDIADSSKLFITSAGDSAENFMLYSGYIYFSAQNKWKLLGTCRMNGEWTTLKNPASFASIPAKGKQPVQLDNIWCQRSNGSWKNLQSTDSLPPVLLPFSNTDSTNQFAIEKEMLGSDITSGKTDVKEYKEGLYYSMMKTGNGKAVAVTDTVTVFYKGYLYANGKVFDQTKDKPARFALSRLIKGWQVGLPLCAVGGKIKLVLLSGQAYAIRTRAAKIPPNSILVFEIEVVNAEAPY
jgi:FKBP-type peptidyl-prolyl cis-trans isomerase FkpA